MNDLEDMRELELMSGPFQPWQQVENEIPCNSSESCDQSCSMPKRHRNLEVSSPVLSKTGDSNTR